MHFNARILSSINKQEILTHQAFANAVDRPTKRIERSVCDDMYLILETMT